MHAEHRDPRCRALLASPRADRQNPELERPGRSAVCREPCPEIGLQAGKRLSRPLLDIISDDEDMLTALRTFFVYHCAIENDS